MQDSPGHRMKDMFDHLIEVRKQLNACQEQQEAMEQRLQLFRQRQKDLQAQLGILHMEKQYYILLRQEQDRKQAERIRREERRKQHKARTKRV